MSSSLKSTCYTEFGHFLKFCCLFIAFYLPPFCLFVEWAQDTPTEWAIGATILSFVSSVVMSYPLRVMTKHNNIEKNPGLVNLCFAYWVLSFFSAAFKWELWLPSSESGILTIATYMVYVFVFYVAELDFHHFVLALDPRLGSFEEAWNDRLQRLSVRSRQAEGMEAGAPAVVAAPELDGKQAVSVPPPYPAANAGHFPDMLFSGKTTVLPPSNV